MPFVLSRTYSLLALAAGAHSMHTPPTRTHGPHVPVKSTTPVQADTFLAHSKAVTTLAALLTLGCVDSAAHAISPLSSDQVAHLTYDQVKGTGLASKCAMVDGDDRIAVTGNVNGFTDLCIEPVSISVVDDDQTVEPAKLVTRKTATLVGLEGDLATDNGQVVLTERTGAHATVGCMVMRA